MPTDEQARKMRIVSAKYRDHALFACYAPFKNPEIAIAVIMENAGHGGSAAAPVARKIIDAYFQIKKSGNKPAAEANSQQLPTPPIQTAKKDNP